ncbi:MAG: PilN domain-containing protein [Bdellovibrionota bacterium]
MPIDHIGIEWGPFGVRLARVEASLGSVEFASYEAHSLKAPVEVPASPPPEGAAPAAEAAPPPPPANGGTPPAAAAEELPPDPNAPVFTPEDMTRQATLAEIVRTGAFQGRFSAIALPSPAVTTRIFQFPFTSKKKIDLVLEPEFEGVTPFEAQGFILDHVPLDQADGGARHLAFGCERKHIAHELTLARGAGIEPRILGVAGATLAALPLFVGEPPAPVPSETPAEGEAPPPAESPAPSSGAATEPVRKKYTASRFNLEAAPCAALLYISEAEASLLVLRHGKPWLLHGSGAGLPVLWGQGTPTLRARVLGKELRRVLTGFESNFGEGPSEIWALGAGVAEAGLLSALQEELGLPVKPARLDPAAVGEKAVAVLEKHPEAALAIALAFQSAREKYVPAPNLRRKDFAFRNQWRDILEPLALPGAILAAVLVFFLINTLLAFGNYRRQLDITRAQLRQLYQDAKGGEPPADPVAALRQELEEKRQRLDVFQTISGVSILNILAELSKSIEKDVTLDFENFRIDSDRVTVNGRTENYESIDKIKGYLQKSPLFKEVDFRDTNPDPSNQKIKFILALTLTTAAEQEEAAGETGEPAGDTPPESEGAPPPDASGIPTEAAPAADLQLPEPPPVEGEPGLLPGEQVPPPAPTAPPVNTSPEPTPPPGTAPPIEPPPNLEQPGRLGEQRRRRPDAEERIKKRKERMRERLKKRYGDDGNAGESGAGGGQ